MVRYAEKNGVTKASMRHRVSRQAIYERKGKYDGSWKSLRDKSHRPHSHPKEHSEEEYRLIERNYAYYKNDKLRMWDRLRKKGYSRCYKSMLRAIERLNLEQEEAQCKGYQAKPYQRAEYAVQKVQIDVKLSYHVDACQMGRNTTNTRQLTNAQDRNVR